METDSIINTIKQSGIKPIPKKYFILKRYLVIGLGALVTIMGGFVFAKIVASVLATSWEYWDYVSNSFGYFLYFSMPVLWVILLFVFITLIPFIIEKTKQGYKYKKIILVLFSILSSIVLGVLILKIGSFSGMNNFLTNDILKKEAAIWTNPDSGMLSGYVVTLGQDSLILEDIRSQIWAVDISNIFPASMDVLLNTNHIRIVGREIDDNTFVACQIMAFDEIGHISKDKKTESIQPMGIKNKSNLVDDICSLVLGEF